MATVIDEDGVGSSFFEPITRIQKDLALAARDLTSEQARYMVDAYYSVQKQRVGMGNLRKAMAEEGEPNLTVEWLGQQAVALENSIRRAMDIYSSSTTVGEWSKSITGIGPVLAAGLMAHIDIERAQTAGAIWRFAGYDPTSVWEKGKKRPFNARLKVLCWKIGQSFIKVQNHETDVYGKVYAQRRAQEEERNDSGAYAELAASTLEERNFKGDTVTRAAYKAGRLPDGRIQHRASRVAVKLFLAHWHAVAYRSHFGKQEPLPYVIEHGGHVHHLQPPNCPSELLNLEPSTTTR